MNEYHCVGVYRSIGGGTWSANVVLEANNFEMTTDNKQWYPRNDRKSLIKNGNT